MILPTRRDFAEQAHRADIVPPCLKMTRLLHNRNYPRQQVPRRWRSLNLLVLYASPDILRENPLWFENPSLWSKQTTILITEVTSVGSDDNHKIRGSGQQLAGNSLTLAVDHEIAVAVDERVQSTGLLVLGRVAGRPFSLRASRFWIAVRPTESTMLLRSISIQGGVIMRFLVKVSFPVEPGNQGAKDGFKAIQAILQQQRPEAAYFLTENGKRTGLLILNMNDASEIPAIAEPWFLALNATVEITPVMIPEDLAKAAPAIADAVKAYG
jgi:hypothetical protein